MYFLFRFIDLLEKSVPRSHNRNNRAKVLVFANTKRTCDFLSQSLRRCGYAADALHGDKSQSQRDRLLRGKKIASTTTKIVVSMDCGEQH